MKVSLILLAGCAIGSWLHIDLTAVVGHSMSGLELPKHVLVDKEVRQQSIAPNKTIQTLTDQVEVCPYNQSEEFIGESELSETCYYKPILFASIYTILYTPDLTHELNTLPTRRISPPPEQC